MLGTAYAAGTIDTSPLSDSPAPALAIAVPPANSSRSNVEDEAGRVEDSSVDFKLEKPSTAGAVALAGRTSPVITTISGLIDPRYGIAVDIQGIDPAILGELTAPGKAPTRRGLDDLYHAPAGPDLAKIMAEYVGSTLLYVLNPDNGTVSVIDTSLIGETSSSSTAAASTGPASGRIQLVQEGPHPVHIQLLEVQQVW